MRTFSCPSHPEVTGGDQPEDMRATILVPVAAVLVAGAVGVVGVSMTSGADEVPAGPIVVHAPQRMPDQMPDQVPAAPARPAPAPVSPRVTAQPKVPPAQPDVPAPPPAVGSDDDWDDWDDDYSGDYSDEGSWDD